MKHLILTAVLVSGLTMLAAKNANAQQDSVKIKKGTINITSGKDNIKIGKGGISVISGKDTIKVDRIHLNFKGGKHSTDDTDDATDSTSNKSNTGRFVGGITFTRLDIGFSKLVDNGSFALSAPNQLLDYRASKTSNVSFDVIQLGYRFNRNFKIYIAGGFDWTLIRLKNDITITRKSPTLAYTTDPILYSKNRFSSSYLHIPLNFEFRTNESNKGKRFYVVVGPEVGFLLNGKVKQISDENGKQKFKDDYNFSQFRFGGTLRMGYNSLGMFVKYYTTNMFETTAQKGLRNMAFGLTFGLN